MVARPAPPTYVVNLDQVVCVADWAAIRALSQDRGNFEALASLVERWTVPRLTRDVMATMPLAEFIALAERVTSHLAQVALPAAFQAFPTTKGLH